MNYNLNIYFTTTFSQALENKKMYKSIIDGLKEAGHRVEVDYALPSSNPDDLDSDQDKQLLYYREMVSKINKCDLLIAEVSYPSTVHVGHKLTLALSKQKPVLALHLPDKKPNLLRGIFSEKFYLAEYDLKRINQVIQDSIEYLAEQQDARFNFFIPPKIQHYLDWVAKHKRIPRAVYLRQLIDQDIDESDF